ncbi:hypothetical protein ABK040_004839 [Willaertia magna]
MSSLSDDVTQFRIQIHINEKENFRLDGVRSDETFNQVMDMFQEERCLLLKKNNYKFALLPSDIEKTLAKEQLIKKRNKDLLKELVHVQMNDSIGQSTYAPFIHDNTMHLQLSPPIPMSEMNKIFGKPLGFLFLKEKKKDTELPDFFEICFKFISNYGIQQTGIFRINGSVKKTESLKQQFDETINNNYKPLIPTIDPHNISSLLKMYFRELPTPIIPFNCYENLKSLFEKKENELITTKDLIIQLREIIHDQFPIRNLTVLEKLMALCNLVVKFKDENKMTDENVSLVIGPNLMWPPEKLEGNDSDDKDESSKLAYSQAHSLKDTPFISNVISTMILNYSQLFDNNSPYDDQLKGLKSLEKDKIWKRKEEEEVEALDTIKKVNKHHSSILLPGLTSGGLNSPLNKVLNTSNNNRGSNSSGNSGGALTRQGSNLNKGFVSFDQNSPLASRLQNLTSGGGSGNSSISSSPMSPTLTKESKKKKEKNFRGHLARSVVEKLSVGPDMMYPLSLIRLTGESLVCATKSSNEIDNNTNEKKLIVDREIPFDHIISLKDKQVIEVIYSLKNELKLEEEGEDENLNENKQQQLNKQINGIRVNYQLKSGVTSSIIITLNESNNLIEWKDEFERILKRYETFVTLAKLDPDNYGAVLTKQEFMNAKQAKQLAQQKKIEERTKSTPLEEIETKNEENEQDDIEIEGSIE